MTVVAELASFAVARRAAPLPEAVRHAAVRAVVDWVAAAVPGSLQPPTRILAEALAGEAGTGTGTATGAEAGAGAARLVPSGRPVGVRTAALLNGTAAHAAELDDIYRDAYYHPGAPTVAAALAVAEHADASGEDLLRAVTIGYEVGTRVALAVGPAHYQHWHTTGTVGALGAAAAAAEVLRLDAGQFANALATAATMSAGLQQAFRSPSMSKPLHAGHAAESGTLAALAASRGLTGAPDVLEGPAGFGAATTGTGTGTGAGTADWSVAVSGLGDPFSVAFSITQTTVKNHACCGHAFAAIDAALELRASGVRAQDVASVEIETYQTAVEIAGRTIARDGADARFSLPYTVAAALVLGTARLRAFTPEAIAHPAIQRLTARTTLRVDPELDALAPRRRGARVRLTDQHGAQHECLRRTRRGDPDDPLSDDELRAKFDDLVPPFIGERRARALAAALWNLPALRQMRALDWGASEGPGPPRRGADPPDRRQPVTAAAAAAGARGRADRRPA